MSSERKPRSQDPLLYSCISPVFRIGSDSEMPGYPAVIGLEAHLPRFGGIHLFISHPKLSSLEEGESLELDIDELDEKLTSSLLEMAGECRTLAKDLLSHAERLEKEAKRDFLPILKEVEKDMEKAKERAGRADLRPSPVQPKPILQPDREPKSSPRSPSVNLDIFS